MNDNTCMHFNVKTKRCKVFSRSFETCLNGYNESCTEYDGSYKFSLGSIVDFFENTVWNRGEIKTLACFAGRRCYKIFHEPEELENINILSNWILEGNIKLVIEMNRNGANNA